MSGWGDEIAVLESQPPPVAVTKTPKRKKKRDPGVLVEGSDTEGSELEDESAPQEEGKTKEQIGEELSDALNKISQKFLSVQKSAAVVGSGKPWPVDGNEARQKIQKKLDAVKAEQREEAKTQRSAILKAELDQKFRINLEQGMKTLDENIKLFATEFKKRCMDSPAPQKPAERPKEEEEVDPLDNLQILQDECDVEGELQQEKNEGLLELEESFDACSDVINDLAVMVHEQGELIDKIESNVSTAKDNVHEGVASLADAKKYQAEARKKIVMMAAAALLSVIGGIVGLIIYLKTAGVMMEMEMNDIQLDVSATNNLQLAQKHPQVSRARTKHRARLRARRGAADSNGGRVRHAKQMVELLERHLVEEYGSKDAVGMLKKAFGSIAGSRKPDASLLRHLEFDLTAS